MTTFGETTLITNGDIPRVHTHIGSNLYIIAVLLLTKLHGFLETKMQE